LADVLPSRLEKGPSSAYMVDRTLLRPRDLIEFFNSCLDRATGRPALTREMILKAEAVYSKNRMRSLQDEWIAEYPSLVDFTALLKQQPRVFRLGSMQRGAVEEFCLTYAISYMVRQDLLSVHAKAVADGVMSYEAFLCTLFHVFYLTGIVGLKRETFEGYEWAHEATSTIVADTINLDSGVSVHPMFHRVLGIKSS
jgi:hypothetical protein